MNDTRFLFRVLFVALLAGSLAVDGILAQLPLGNPTLVNTATTGDQQGGRVAMRNDGRFVVVWQESSADGGDILSRVYDSAGSPFAVSTFSQFAGVAQTLPALSMNGSGDFVAAWLSDSQVSGSAKDVFARRSSSNGTVLTSEFQVNATGSHDPGRVRVSRAEDDSFVACWTDDDTNTAIFCRRFGANGVPVTGDVPVNQSVVATSTFGVAAAPNGSFVVTWISSGSGTGVLARCFAADGTALGDEITIPQNPSGSEDAPAIGIDARAAFVVVWREGGQAGHYEMRLFDPDCTPRSSDLAVDEALPGQIFGPFIDVAPDGAFVVAWGGTREDADRGVTAREFDRDGHPVGAQFLVNVDTVGAQNGGSVGIGGAHFAIAFDSPDASGPSGQSDMYVRRYRRRLALLDGFESGDLVYWSAVRP